MARLQRFIFAPTSTTALLGTTATTGGVITSVNLANPYPFVFDKLARSITVTSSDDLSAVNITITGTDLWGNVQSEVLVGPTAAATVTSAKQYRTITNIAASADLTNFSIGTGATGTFTWSKQNTFSKFPSITIQGDVLGTITYSVNQTTDPLDYYTYPGGTVSYTYPKSVQLGANPITVANGTAVATVTVPSTAGLVTGQSVTIQGSTNGSGITAAQLNLTAIITVASATTFTYTAGANGNGVAGGGANVYYYSPALPVPFAVVAGLTGATTSQIYTLTTPTTALQGSVTTSTGGSLTLTYLQQGVD